MSLAPAIGSRDGRAARRRRRGSLVAATLCALAATLPGATARADLFGPISLASVGTLGGGVAAQAEYAHDAAISGDGRYVAFDGAVGGVTGVWRRDLASGAIEQVAGGDAELPSLSYDGRYVSFTSTQDLVGADEARGPNVWRRDMEPGPGEPQYVLVSAVNGSSAALTYDYPNPGQEEAKFGSVAVGRSAISADGNEVAFVTTAASNLAGEGTPALQVAVRRIGSSETVLVSGAYEAGSGSTSSSVPVSGEGGALGAVYPGSASNLGFRASPLDGNWEDDPPPGASISADGSTVAWMGEDLAQQVAMLAGEDPPPTYTEPLWRRIAPGSSTPTERITGGSDPAAPGCAASGEAALPPVARQAQSDPCQGPFIVGYNAGPGGSRGIWSETGGGGQGDYVPRLSADGYRVAFLSSAVPAALGVGFGNEPEGEPADLYVADMHPGLTRAQALTPLTEVGGLNVASSSPITDFEISGDGEQAAFTTRRIHFALGSPASISPLLGEPGESELYEVDLGNETITRVSHGYGGEPSEQTRGSLLDCPEDEDPYCNPITIGAQSPSLSADGSAIAFSSTASNLAYGDGNGPRNRFGTPEGPLDGSDAFVVAREPFASTPTPEYVSPAPQTPIEPDWQLSATVVSRRDGSVVVYVAVPGPGTLSASARSAVPLVASAASTRRRASRARAGADGRGRTRAKVAVRTVAASRRGVTAAGDQVVTLVLRLAGRYGKLASRSGGLYAHLDLAFVAPGRPSLGYSLGATFRRAVASTAHSSRRHGRTARGRTRGPAHGGSGR